ncbi:acetoin dehydrogenase E1 component alpha subunit [Niallia circulans]|jgi:acetoin:2,6-dichlorophenolindophenol oxidoreductase subunit alpha|uniref:ABC transporter substrate-binding protein n=1 Tax=Shouchella clausii TaxID=79880 RepID=A0A268RXB1_SHOCL|nr:thiamine pyrophosphate-dependent dehydrogenase E1 component subunit alpha [Shouchella clausii]SPT80603.1 acetoin dehydrogenase E1 component alpha subunit [Niallia circulans]AST96949.1 ABC transporter substrate-binding protein [Shouchella clausii]MBU8597638.1 thiamine pyrophosphate-dependent dehydrogenase E1 component subunit alpha [Shouchella clausii]MCM3547557.1 thiamine pyrophosphate-dependent dehydrogenase E1 component subunit alpha [Shouchella clausii]MCY1105271.1 thiamine pyrophosphate
MKKKEALWIYQKMNEIRLFEEEVHRTFGEGIIPGFVHLYAGEEAVATGVSVLLDEEDYITSTHRGHGHAIAKGCDINRMMAEIMGKKDGLGGGKGGSMHVADIEKGMLGANGIVGGGFGLAAGAALTIKTLRQDHVAVCFFGDGASNEGLFHEGLNLASILKLPVIFVCENNQFGEGTPFRYASASETVAERAAAYNMPGVRVDGMKVVDVYSATKEAIRRAKAGEGPTLIECDTYRHYGHFEGDEQKYKSEADQNRDRDPIPEFRKVAVEKGWMTSKQADEIEKEAAETIKKASEFAQNSPLPDVESLYTDIFA